MKIEKVKNLAKRFKRALLEQSLDVSHTLCLEAIAAGLGFRSYVALQSATITAEPLQWNAERAVDRLIAISHMRTPTRKPWQAEFKDPQPFDRAALLRILAELPLHLGPQVAHV